MDLTAVLRFLDERQRAGQRAALVTICAVEGSSMRNPGTIMGVAEDGRFAGSLSGGCIENAVVAEALDTLKAGTPRVMRFGAGSPYLDIKLPCGGGLDLHFAPLVASEFVALGLQSVSARAPFTICVGPGGVEHRPQWHPPAFDSETASGVFGQWPAPLLQVVGHGAGVEALAALASLSACETRVLTPDERIVEALLARGEAPALLKRRTQTDLLASDPWSAFVFLFHDHDWEIDLMERSLALPHFYIGAMGGRRAHAMRSEALLARGVSQAALDAIRAPIGVFHSSRDPHTLALSTLAEVIRAYQNTDFEAALG
ncbi:MAG: XdhC family protein [Pseudomonadota bacterium]